MKLSIKEIIFFKYLTKYNIKAIKENVKVFDNFEQLYYNLIQQFSAEPETVKECISLTDIALHKLDYYGIKYITYFDDEFPNDLKKIDDAPLVIYYKGILDTGNLAAVVGSRDTSQYARKLTYQVVDWLKETNMGVVSGLALGIDTLAHERAIENKQYTIAVLPTALDTIYPTVNYKLANQILDNGGCLISELIFGINRGNQSFVQRNRIQSALSEIVIPVEMGVKSGTMHTIDFAKRYHKKIALFKPTPLLAANEHYFGITHLINHPHKYQHIFTDKESFFKIVNSSGEVKQLDMDL